MGATGNITDHRHAEEKKCERRRCFFSASQHLDGQSFGLTSFFFSKVKHPTAVQKKPIVAEGIQTSECDILPNFSVATTNQNGCWRCRPPRHACALRKGPETFPPPISNPNIHHLHLLQTLTQEAPAGPEGRVRHVNCSHCYSDV